ncbi:MAG: helix-turn-helix domain-containing protein [Gammaproteobacteria bacterium]|nr:helix-turn-helix domain-containing protein [Gammaproteobacteria bacterium]MDH5619539.1 helix-turn-helix domain-containing protein [Gammaproteobacteria bacterium]
MSTYIVRRLEQAKLLTDPFKLKLLERFAAAPATTKQVADRLGEKAPRLYRHVDALVEENLLELVEEKPKRGTIERYYRTVADRFEVDPDLFATTSAHADESVDMIRSLFRDTESDLLRCFSELRDADADEEELPMIAKFAFRGTPDEVRDLRQKLEAVLEGCGAHCGEQEDPEGQVSYTGMVAFYPQSDN